MANIEFLPDDLPPGGDDFPPPTEMPRSNRKSNTRGTALKTSLTKMYESIGLGIGMLGDQHCGTIIIDSAPNMAEAMDQWARENPRVKKALEKMLEGTAITAVIAAHAPIGIAIYSHHVAPAIAARRERNAAQEEPEPNNVFTGPFPQQGM